MIHYFLVILIIWMQKHVENYGKFATDDNLDIFFHIKQILCSENYQTVLILNYSRFIASKEAVQELTSN